MPSHTDQGFTQTGVGEMSEQWYGRIDERDQGRRRLRRMTGWTAAMGVALASAFGVALARHDAAAAAPVNQNQITDDTGGQPTRPSSGGGHVIQPPHQQPQPAPGPGNIFSGGS
jgi:hypothetical protein